MGKKKREQVVFDQMLTTKKNIPFHLVNKECAGKKKNFHKKEGTSNEK